MHGCAGVQKTRIVPPTIIFGGGLYFRLKFQDVVVLFFRTFCCGSSSGREILGQARKQTEQWPGATKKPDT